MAYVVTAYIIMAYVVTAHVVMAYVVVAYIVMAYVVNTRIGMRMCMDAPAGRNFAPHLLCATMLSRCTLTGLRICSCIDAMYHTIMAYIVYSYGLDSHGL